MKHSTVIFKSFSNAFVVLAVLTLIFTARFSYGQYDYYDPYSNSNIDYYPMNPVDTSPSRTSDYQTSGNSSSGVTTSPSPSPTPSTTSCANKPLPNPQNTRSVEIRDKAGKVFYLSPPQEEVIGLRAYPETSTKIYRIIYGSTGMQVDEKEIGEITVSNSCYPKYGYVKNETSVTSPSPSTSVVSSNTMPPDTTAVKLDPTTGKVYNAATGVLISDARYDSVPRKIFYQDTNSIFGGVLSDTTGYVNIKSTATVSVSPSAVTYSEPGNVARDERMVKPDPVYGAIGKAFILDGTKSQDDGILKYFNWEQLEGPKVTIANSQSLKPTFTPQTPGTYVFELHALDSAMGEYIAQRAEFIIGNDAPASEGASSAGLPPGDPDFDLLRAAGNLPPGDPDFDLLNITLGLDEVKELRENTEGKVQVRGWDPEKKEEIIAHPENVKTADDLKIYSEAIILRDEAIHSIEIKEKTIEIGSTEKGKLFWLFSVDIPARVTVSIDESADSKEYVKVKYPWWHIFVKKTVAPSVLKAEITGALSAGESPVMTDLSFQEKMSRVSRMLELMTNIMKTKHDTAKNSISNIR